MKYTVEYDTNNSGGGWWLSDEDWKRLEVAGWDVQWVCDKSTGRIPEKDGRWLGAMACEAHFEVDTYGPEEALRQAIQSWERVIGKDSSLEGCNCCGPPHSFAIMKIDEDGDLVRDWGTSISGEEIAFFLSGKERMSTRELLEELKKREG